MPTVPQGFTYIVYKNMNNNTVAQKSDSSNPIIGANPDVVINQVLQDPGPLDDGQRYCFMVLKMEVYYLTKL
jgi:hypothetical protein